jgi:putative Mg2+ transporter-C (MgtC) family protein
MDPLTTAAHIGTAALLGAIIGIEREINGNPAGLRTHIILAIGAALASMLSISFSQDFSSSEFQSDPARIVAQVISGVGFLGAGAIMRFGVNVKGITTATSLWTTAIIGIACGAGYYYAAAIAAISVFIALTILNRLGHVLLTAYKIREFKVRIADRPNVIHELRSKLVEIGVKILSMNTTMPDKHTVKIDMVVRVPSSIKMDRLINAVNQVDETHSAQIT